MIPPQSLGDYIAVFWPANDKFNPGTWPEITRDGEHILIFDHGGLWDSRHG